MNEDKDINWFEALIVLPVVFVQYVWAWIKERI